MPVPDTFEITKPLLELFSDGEEHDYDSKFLEKTISEKLGFDLDSMTSNEKEYFKRSIKTARTFLKKHGLLYSPSFPMYAITDTGRKTLEDDPDIIDENYFSDNGEIFTDLNSDSDSEITAEVINPEIEDSDSDSDFDESGINIEDDIAIGNPEILENIDVPISHDDLDDLETENSNSASSSNANSQIVPKNNNSVIVSFENLDNAVERLNENLADNILVMLSNLEQESFEQLVIDLLSKMGYRAFRNARYTNEISGDNLIHGVILEDKAGLTPIYIQAKKSNPEREIGRAELQNFSKVLADRGGKGLFATTASFSEEAEIYAQDEHLMLIDGNKLSQLMIAKDFCVSVEKVVQIKSIDKESFSEYVR